MRRAIAILALAALGLPAASVAQRAVVEGTVRSGERAAGSAVVYLVPQAEIPAPRAAETLIDQRKLRFVPDIVGVVPGGTVVFRNSDPLLHNIFGPRADEPFDLGTYPEGESRSHRFLRPGPHVVLCNIHPEMEAWVFVAPTPYQVVTGPDGRFRLEAPPGRYQLHAWHRRAGAHERDVEIAAGRVSHIEILLAPSDPRARAGR